MRRRFAAVLGAVPRAIAALRPDAAARSAGERSLLDDIAVRRPWNVVVKLARLRARLRLRRLRPGATVVVVSWNTREVLADVLRAVRRFSPDGTPVLVLDNGSSDGSLDLLRTVPGVAVRNLRRNAGHGVALDLGVCSVRTRIAVALDSDAIPLRHGWLDPVVEPIESGRAVLAGTRASRGFVHPMFLAVDVATFVRERLSFQVHRAPGVTPTGARWGVDAWDTGEVLTARVGLERIEFVEPTDNPVPGLPGMTAGGVVYHHGGVSRGGSGRITEDALQAWKDACRALGVPGDAGLSP